jgi:hypothetical protein
MSKAREGIPSTTHDVWADDPALKLVIYAPV